MKKFLKKLAKVLAVFIFEIAYILGLGIYLIYYTDMFTTTRDMIVTTSMTTMTHQYFATWFLSDEKINEILASNRLTNETEEQSLEDIEIAEIEEDNSGSKEGIEVIPIETDSFKAYLMIIDDPSRVELVTSPDVGIVGSTTSQIVEYYGAIAGINAGGLADDAYGTGADPTGLLIIDGQHYNDINYYDYHSMCGFTQDNKLYVSDSISRASIDALNLRCAVSFGPALIVNGTPRISGGGGWGIQPRTCIGQRQDGAVLFLVIDGRQKDSVGATLKHAQDILLNYGAYNAFNLDGGASSTMVFDGALVNNPSDIAGERYVPTAFIVK
ncbi:MAG: phosphodiester glycosidase family protein [Clostridia bacterium]|nr:phosphodiester glycosidase family protein [Clostridia bacterium]